MVDAPIGELLCALPASLKEQWGKKTLSQARLESYHRKKNEKTNGENPLCLM